MSSKPTPKSATDSAKEAAKPVLSVIKDIQPVRRRGPDQAPVLRRREDWHGVPRTGHPAHRPGRPARRSFHSLGGPTEICRREGMNPNVYYRWIGPPSSKEFLEAGKKRLMGDSIREATAPEVNFEQKDGAITIFPNEPTGFAVSLFVHSDMAYTVYFDSWHEEFTQAEEALECFAFGLSDQCRLKVSKRGGKPYKWTVESQEDGV